MLRGILLALDRSPEADGARKLAILLAQRHRAAVKGVLIIDPNPAENERAAAVSFAQRFTYDCHEAQVHGEASVVQGQTVRMLATAAAPYDVVVLAQGTTGASNPLIAGMLTENPRPLVIAPKEIAVGARTIIAYDGSIAAMRTLQLFCLLQIRLQGEAAVVSIDHDAGKAAALAEVGAVFLRDHGYRAVTRPIVTRDDAAGALLDTAKAIEAGMIVAGAPGATATRLLASSGLPLFLHH